ncbi:MAG: hypothetical protein IJ242_04695 [Clostridia bacterium]|nr:hypothetical protein [Clostridia bacterium]
MIELFPNLIRRFLILSAVLIVSLTLMTVLVPGSNPVITVVIGIIGIGMFLTSQAAEATRAHTQLVNRLYEQLDAEGFLKSYEPFLRKQPHNKNVLVMIRLHLSNAYTALGRYSDAEHILLDAGTPSDRNPEKALISRFAIVSNLCSCKEQEQKTEDAGAYLKELLSIRDKLDALQQQKPEKKRLVFNTTSNEICYAFLKDGTCDTEALRSIIQNNTSKLERLAISLWIARMYIRENRISEARDLLEKAVKIGSHLSYGQQAQALLDTLNA